MKKLLLPLVLVSLTAACTQILPFGSERERTFTLSAQKPLLQGDRNGPVIFLDDPIMAEGLGGRVVTVNLPDGERSVVKGMRWAEPLSSLVRHYLEQNMAGGTDAQLVGEGGLDVRAACRLGVKVWAFELTPGASVQEDKVRLSIEGVLVKLSGGGLLARRVFNGETGVDGNDFKDVAQAFDQAFAPVAADMADWLNASLADCSEE